MYQQFTKGFRIWLIGGGLFLLIIMAVGGSLISQRLQQLYEKGELKTSTGQDMREFFDESQVEGSTDRPEKNIQEQTIKK